VSRKLPWTKEQDKTNQKTKRREAQQAWLWVGSSGAPSITIPQPGLSGYVFVSLIITERQMQKAQTQTMQRSATYKISIRAPIHTVQKSTSMNVRTGLTFNVGDHLQGGATTPACRLFSSYIANPQSTGQSLIGIVGVPLYTNG
jgi:hypothetical protein